MPNGHSNRVTVIDPATSQVIDVFHLGALPQHVVPQYELSTLYVNNNQGELADAPAGAMFYGANHVKNGGGVWSSTRQR